MSVVNILLYFTLANIALANNLPKWIQKCEKSNIEKCGPTTANEIWRHIYRGHSGLNIPSFDPFKIGSVNIHEDLLKIALRNGELKGLNTIRVYKTNFNDSILTLGFSLNYLTLKGEFEEFAEIGSAILPVAGFANFTMRNVNVNMNISFRTNDQFIELRFAQTEITPRQTTISFSQLSNSPPYMVIENSKTLSEMLLTTLKTILFEVLKESAEKLFNKYTVKELFLEKP